MEDTCIVVLAWKWCFHAEKLPFMHGGGLVAARVNKNVHYSQNKLSTESHASGMSMCSCSVKFPALLEGKEFNANKMAAVAVASQSTPPETHCWVDDAGPVLWIVNDHVKSTGSCVTFRRHTCIPVFDTLFSV